MDTIITTGFSSNKPLSVRYNRTVIAITIISLAELVREAWHSSSMAPSYYHSAYSTRDHFVEPPSIFGRILLALPRDLAVSLQRMADQNAVSTRVSRIPRWMRQCSRDWSWRRVFSLPHLLIVVWVVGLFHGERWIFEKSIKACAWDNWERWVSFRG